eukprot:1152498-Pyramimonas_sp.AAC.1
MKAPHRAWRWPRRGAAPCSATSPDGSSARWASRRRSPGPASATVTACLRKGRPGRVGRPAPGTA